MQFPIDTKRHSLAHIMAYAVQKLYGKRDLVQFGIGPVVENGFYYDFDMKYRLEPSDLPKIEKEMKRVLKENHPFVKTTMPIGTAIEHFEKKAQMYKVALLKDIQKHGTTEYDIIEKQATSAKREKTKAQKKQGDAVSVYRSGDFEDLCRGPHVENTKTLPTSFKLMSIAGAYWRGDEKNPMLQRIYAVAFDTTAELTAYLYQLEEAKKRDHKKLGPFLDLFVLRQESPGSAFWLPRGVTLRNILTDYWRKEHKRENYQEVMTPILLNQKLWKTSGHWSNYREQMFITKDAEQVYAIKPMNCPGGILLYASEKRSYKELPLRLAELGFVHRNELSGTLNGLLRVRFFTQDDAHIFIRASQIAEEYDRIINLTERVYKKFGFPYRVELSTRPAKYMGDLKVWDNAEKTLETILREKNMDYKINRGDGAFYGPKIDFHIQDSLKRTWQVATIQLDLQQPNNFGLTYINEHGKEERPVIIHRVIYGSLERFIGILIEHHAGSFPAWLAPVQARCLSVSEKHNDGTRTIAKELEDRGLRVEIDLSNDTVGYKTRNAIQKKIPYILVIGDKETQQGAPLSVRERDTGKTVPMNKEAFIERVLGE